MSSGGACFVVECSPSIGGGHLARCSALALTMQEFGTETSLYCANDARAVLPRAVDVFCTIDERASRGKRWQTVVFDGYGLSTVEEAAWEASAKKRLVLDDLADRSHQADVLVDSGPDRSPSDYACKVPGSCAILTGLRYSILSPLLRRVNAWTDNPSTRPSLIVNMGATDPGDATSRILDHLRDEFADWQIDVVLGLAAPHIEKVQRETTDRVRLLVDPSDLYQRLASATLVVGAGGSSALERAFLGVPSVICVLADNQAGLATGLFNRGACLMLAAQEWQDQGMCKSAIRRLASSAPLRRQLSDQGRRAVDGRGTHRILCALADRMHVASGALLLRLCETSDIDWLHWLQSRAETRRFARDNAVPSFAEHETWMHRKFASPECFFTVIEWKGQPAGFIRLDSVGPGTAEVSIAFDPDVHGRGLAQGSLRLLREMFPGLHLRAFVKHQNAASLRLFERTGYQAQSTDQHGKWLVSNAS